MLGELAVESAEGADELLQGDLVSVLVEGSHILGGVSNGVVVHSAKHVGSEVCGSSCDEVVVRVRDTMPPSQHAEEGLKERYVPHLQGVRGRCLGHGRPRCGGNLYRRRSNI